MDVDVLVIGGGIAGVSLGYELALNRSVALVEMESALAFHTSGRSAATYLESYGGPVIRALTRGSRRQFEDPAMGDILSERGLLWFADDDNVPQMRAFHAEVRMTVPDCQLLSGPEAEQVNPLLAPGACQLAVYEPGAMDIDVHALHQGYVRGLKARGGTVHTQQGLTSVKRTEGYWRVTLANGEVVRADVIANASGAWADEVAIHFGARPLGLVPLRRSAFIVSMPTGIPSRTIPLTCHLNDSWYFLPRGETVLCSPADETPQPPCDTRPDELEIARCIDALNATTTLNIRSIRSPWAGQRTFAPDRIPVVGFDPQVEGLFWYAGLGGYGMQTAPALSRTGAALVRHEPIPIDLADEGVRAGDLGPARLYA